MTISFIQRHIDVTFTLGEGNFGLKGSNTVKQTGLRTRVSVTKNGAAGMGVCHLQIYGMKLSTMNKLSTLGISFQAGRHNYMQIDAGDDEIGMSSIFGGYIHDAFVDLNGAPDACLNVISYEGAWEGIKPVPPVSYRGNVGVAIAIERISRGAGLGFENNGVDITVQNPYLPGTARQQIYALARAANISIVIDRGVVAIWPRGGARRNKVVDISSSTGLKGYPSFTAGGVRIECLFLPFVEYGCQFKLESQLTPANKIWVVQRLHYDLESENSDGRWFMTIDANELGYAYGSQLRPD